MRKLTITLIFFTALFAACTPPPKPTGWILLHPSNNPPTLGHGGFAYDARSNEAVVFGGLANGTWSDETWVWNGDNWLRANSPTNPSAREKLAMAYDGARERIILFGGVKGDTVFDETWEWNGSSWQNPTIDFPPVRQDGRVVYDNKYERAILFGGVHNGGYLNDTWIFDGQIWHRLAHLFYGQVPSGSLNAKS